MQKLIGITVADLRREFNTATWMQYASNIPLREEKGLFAVALAAQKALIKMVWGARFLGQPWESSIEEMMLQLGENPYRFPKGTLKVEPCNSE